MALLARRSSSALPGRALRLLSPHSRTALAMVRADMQKAHSTIVYACASLLLAFGPARTWGYAAVPHFDNSPVMRPLQEVCAAPRSPWLTDMDKPFPYIIQGTVVRKPSVFGSLQSATVKVYRSLKGRFTSRQMLLTFNFRCGAGGPELQNGQKITMYLSVTKPGDGKTYGYVDYWRSASTSREAAR